MFFGSKKPEVDKKEDVSSKDLALINQMNNDLAGSLDLKETLQNALELIIKRINAQAANVFFIEDKKQVFVKKHADYWLDIGRPSDYEIAINDYETKIKKHLYIV